MAEGVCSTIKNTDISDDDEEIAESRSKKRKGDRLYQLISTVNSIKALISIVI